MAGFLLRLMISALGLWLAARLVPGMQIHGAWTLLGASFLLGAVNAFVRPVAVLLTLPFTILTLGFFLLVINAAMLAIVAWLLDGFRLASFGSALLGSIIVSLTGWLASWWVGPTGRVEVMIVERQQR
jgi:putative membrane protein